MLPLPEPPFSGFLELNPNPAAKLAAAPSPFVTFSPTAALPHGAMHELLLAADFIPIASDTQPPANPMPEEQSGAGAAAMSRGPGRKRTVRRDRHSKILTAQGTRDRRIRLSLDVARRFFDLQDMLGFDQPSKTIQWLLNNSTSAIRDLAAGHVFGGGSSSGKSESLTSSECEDISTISDDKIGNPQVSTTAEGKALKGKRTLLQAARRNAADPNLAKESRAKARAKARERTKEKKRMKLETSQLLPSPVALEAFEESGSHGVRSSIELVADVDELCSQIRPFQSFNYQQNIVGSNDTVAFYQEHWGPHFAVNNTEGRAFLGDEQFHGKPWANNCFMI